MPTPLTLEKVPLMAPDHDDERVIDRRDNAVEPLDIQRLAQSDPVSNAQLAVLSAGRQGIFKVCESIVR
jgi:hypothetical protein